VSNAASRTRAAGQGCWPLFDSEQEQRIRRRQADQNGFGGASL